MRQQERDRRVDELLAAGLTGEIRGRWLLAGRLPEVESVLRDAGVEIDRWVRTAVGGEPGPALVPPRTGYDGAVLRLPRGSEAAEMALHLIAARLAADGALWVGGANDEGIRGARRRIGTAMDEIVEEVPGGHARRALAIRPRAEVRGALDDWAHPEALVLPDATEARPWTTFPGVFAAGRVDPATALLLANLPDLRGKRVLDFACGSGIVAAVLAARGAHVEASDHDVYAVEAARRNLGPTAVVTCADGIPDGTWDVVVSNPPIHAGHDRDLGVITRAGAALAARLAADGAAYWVTQVTVPVHELVRVGLPRSEIVARDRSFKVVRSSR